MDADLSRRLARANAAAEPVTAVGLARRLLRSTRHHEDHPESAGALWDVDACWDELERLDRELARLRRLTGEP
jgi:hypothetical protein